MLSAARNAGRAPTNALVPEENGWRQVRSNIFQILGQVAVRARWQLAWLAYQLLEGLSTIIILSIVWNSEYCSELYVRPWIILYSGRLVFRIPLSIYFIVAKMRQQNIPSWINILDSFLLVYLIFIWFWGNLWFYQSTTCSSTAPISYFYGVTLISLMYVWLFIPLVIFLGACFCYPLLRLALRACGIGEVGATKRMIAKLPHQKFDGHPIARPDGTVDESGTQCAICMSDFQVGEEIITLPCGHSVSILAIQILMKATKITSIQFNKDCIERWLKLKRICALCRHDITQPGTA